MALTRPSKLIKEDISGSVVNPTTNISGSSVSTGSFGRTEASAIEGTLVTAAQTNVTSVGTIDTGVWNSTFGATANTLVSGSFTTVSSSLASKVTTLEGTGTTQGVGTTNSPTFADVTATGTVTAQEFHTEFISASVLYDSGSTRFGDTTDDTHAFTGSLTTSGSSLIIDSAGTYSGSSTSTGSYGRVEATNYSGLATSATTDTTNASNISSGTLSINRMPAGTVLQVRYANSTTAATSSNNTIGALAAAQSITTLAANSIFYITAHAYLCPSAQRSALAIFKEESSVYTRLFIASQADRANDGWYASYPITTFGASVSFVYAPAVAASTTITFHARGVSYRDHTVTVGRNDSSGEDSQANITIMEIAA